MNLSRLAHRLGDVFQSTAGTMSLAHGAAIGGAAVLLAFASAAHAAPTLSLASNVAVPATTAGVYINVVSGAFGTAAATTGWDINPWSSTGLSFFNPASPTGGVYAISIAGQVASLPVGSVIGAGTTYGSGTATTTAASLPWSLNAVNYFGFRLTNEANSSVHYGYGAMTIGASLLDRTVSQLWFESTPGASITVTAIPEPSSVALMLLGGLGLAGAVARRRRQSAV